MDPLAVCVVIDFGDEGESYALVAMCLRVGLMRSPISVRASCNLMPSTYPCSCAKLTAAQLGLLVEDNKAPIRV